MPRQKLAAGKDWLRRAGGVLGFPIQMGGPHFQLLKKLSLEVDQNHVSKALDPSRGLAEHAAAAFTGVSLGQEGEVEAWLLEQSPGFLPSV